MKVIYKWWRIDRGLWEEKRRFLIFNYYHYSILKGNTLIEKTKLKKYPNPNYLKKAHQETLYIGRKEFREEYESNKWLIPINYTLNLELD